MVEPELETKVTVGSAMEVVAVTASEHKLEARHGRFICHHLHFVGETELYAIWAPGFLSVCISHQ